MNKLDFTISIPKDLTLSKDFIVNLGVNAQNSSVIPNEPNHKIDQANDLSQSNNSLLGRVKHLVLEVFKYIPLVNCIASIVDKYFNDYGTGPVTEARIQNVIRKTPPFQGYVIPGTATKVTSVAKRPANFFFDALLGRNTTTLPGSGELFRINSPWEASWKICNLGDSAEIAFSANDPAGPSVFGDKTYRLSGREIKKLLQSQKIYVSPLIPKNFCLGLKNALHADNIKLLPSSDYRPTLMSENISPTVNAFLREVERNPSNYGFVNNGVMLTFAEIKNLTLYQVGAMIVKSEDYYCFVDSNYRIEERRPDQKDDILLLNLCGIRGFHKSVNVSGNHNHEIDRKIMRHTFETAIKAAGKNAHIVFPAVGMGVWGGSPDVYWRALLDAIVSQGDSVRYVYINPGHQRTPGTRFDGSVGEEFASILKEYQSKFPNNPNLNKIVNLFHRKTDLLVFAKELKKVLPDEPVALVNASDPDVTLGPDVVGEYVNNLNHAPTTEENYTALGSNGLCFESLSGVRSDPNRVIQCV